jgi:hypothetical protein
MFMFLVFRMKQFHSPGSGQLFAEEEEGEGEEKGKEREEEEGKREEEQGRRLKMSTSLITQQQRKANTN